jgi:DNA-binding SARP family transcriptional activator
MGNLLIPNDRLKFWHWTVCGGHKTTMLLIMSIMMRSLKSVPRSAWMESHVSPLSLNFLGQPEARLGDRLLVFPTRKTQALLIYLAHEGVPQPRASLAALLWPEASTRRSQASLRNTLNRLQDAMRLASDQAQTTYLTVTHDALAVNQDAALDIDLHTVERAYRLARADRASRKPPEGSSSLPLLRSAAACWRGDFLAGFSLGDAPGFDDWADIQREVWRRRLGLVLDRLCEIQFASGEFAGATETAARWIAVDRLNEVAYRLKMRAHFAAGERGLALETFETCCSVLADELQVEPEPDTAALAARIRSQEPGLRPLPRSDTPAAFLEALFAGRAAEHQVLVETYRRAAAGEPQVVVLRGEAGIGKTRLATEFLAWAGAQGTEVLQGAAFESSSHMPFQPLLEALRARLEREDSPQDWLDEAWLGPLSHLLPELRQRYPGLPPALLEQVPLQRENAQTQLFEPFVRLTLALARRAPLVLFVDDLQWADSATLDLLAYAVRRWYKSPTPANPAARILLMVNLRSEALHPVIQPWQTGGHKTLIDWLAHIERESAPHHLGLMPLGEGETIQMVLSILSPPAADFAQWVFDETRGQPFYLMETLKDLLERRVLHPRRRAEGQWAFAVDTEHDLGSAVRVPSTVRAVIRSRLNRLSPNAFSLLAAGAVLEQRISFDRLCAISNVTEDLGLPALDELVSGRLMVEAAQPGAASAYTLANDMIRDVVYTEAGDARRRLFHRRALAALEASRDSAAVLAHHALSAGLAHAAFHYSLAAGREALRLSVAGEAIVHFEQARRLAQEGPAQEAVAQEGAQRESAADFRNLYAELGRAYELDGQPEKALSVYQEMDRIA